MQKLIRDYALIKDYAHIKDHALIKDYAHIKNHALIKAYALISFRRGHQLTDNVKIHIKTAAYRNVRSEEVSSSSKISAGYRESQNETPDTATYQNCQDRMENKSAGHRDCQT
jgi:UDP-3-O-[3-hydroxymyristoyl] glucosamine N-acyltransferase